MRDLLFRVIFVDPSSPPAPRARVGAQAEPSQGEFAFQKTLIESLRKKYQAMRQALGTTNYDSMAQFWERHVVMDKAEYISFLPAGTPRATL
ncbi:hypothetical protein HPB52_022642 [Rhipicephalus sanguineus]|uniref:Uncharacterized protein n=1 Tax=Rhipicephalus sanguineus TaxID=34632 RepID=A0A9D4PXV9_RHISA|nr:hypothetical protein HPB52_022642 [Rhipicephalus sanguineus]